MDLPSPGIVVTGANGQLGRALLSELAAQGRSDVRALVRSQRARSTIEAEAIDPPPDVRIVDYASPKSMEEAIRGAHCVVHLVGIIKEMPGTRYVEAHERTCHALSLAASRADVRRIVYLSILGASPDSENACLASKGRAESLLLDDRVATAVLRVPMVLGGDDPASISLRRQARSDTVWLPGGGRTLQQPIDQRDLVRAILSACEAHPGRHYALNCAGPESLTHRNLVLRAARLWNASPRVRGIPLPIARLAVACIESVTRNPPVTRAMFDILQHDDRVETDSFRRMLDLELTPLDQTLAELIGPESEHAA